MSTYGATEQYTSTAGRIEDAQVAVYLTYAAPRGHAFIDRARYLPKSWAEDDEPATESQCQPTPPSPRSRRSRQR